MCTVIRMSGLGLHVKGYGKAGFLSSDVAPDLRGRASECGASECAKDLRDPGLLCIAAYDMMVHMMRGA